MRGGGDRALGPRGRAAALAIALASNLAGPARLAAQEVSEPRLRAAFWVETEPVASAGEAWPVSSEEAARRLVDEAAWVFAGMVWGFSFEYVPLDRARGIEEGFVLEPLGSIPWGDPRLIPGKLEPAGSRLLPEASFGPSTELRAYVEYRPEAEGARLMEAYGAEPWVRSQGLGRADILGGWKARRAAYEDALREAVREYLRSIEPNKPRRAAGRVVFERVPAITVREGAYLVQARSRIEVLELAPYVVY